MTKQSEPTAHQRTIAGRYAVIREIGRGGMGIVWLAEDRTIGRQVAIKELHLPAGVGSTERRVLEERVLREARTAGRLNDPAVVTVFDVVQEDGNTYIVMELIEAPTLSQIVNQQGPLPQEAVARLAEQLLSALESAHAAGIVHRDVKPSNIMVLPNGRVKLTDFGIAQSTDDPRLTTSGILVGSPSYIAPERLRGSEADPGSDLWALAAVLYFAVEGHSPFERASTAATMNAILNEVPYLTRSHGPLASVIMGLLNSVPDARLSATQVRGLLAHATATPPSGTQTVGVGAYTAPPTQRTDRVRGPRRRNLVIAGLVAALVVGLAGGFFGARALLAEEVDPAKGATLTYGRGGDIEQFEIGDGQCSSARIEAGRQYPSSSQSDCDEPHEFEAIQADVFNNVELDHPGEDVLRPYAEHMCALLFASDLVAAEDKDQTLSYVTLVPTPGSWADAGDDDSENGGDRSTWCLITSRDTSQLEGPQLRQE
ncbi:serine/threonine-protein kinase [Actinophytocola gossypii]|uniref:serine/threonine-protein kinase n=1 Tax=Actinophytocola gossypii TaxID=2812003 RepID=UPI0021A7BE88|nr:serine/threonine-protein kinase [Actinophytocola gossypii]